jgi:predicted dehydrogenase
MQTWFSRGGSSTARVGWGNGARQQSCCRYRTELFAKRPDVEIAYLCDVDERRLGPAARIVEKYKDEKPQVLGDLRRMLDDRQVDAIVNATPEHWHAVSTVLACQARKDVYVEKAASHNIWEGKGSPPFVKVFWER